MRYLKKLLILVPLLLVVTALVAYGQPFRSDEEAYDLGYREGLTHGMADREMGLSFDYRHDHRFRSGISFDSYVNAEFRSGYIEGYKDGYDSRRSTDFDDRRAGLFRDDGHGLVIVHTDDGFEGASREFSVGRYPTLSRDWNDSIESIEMKGNVRVILFDEADFSGRRFMFERDVRDLEDYGFARRAASMIVEPYD